jgi:hypothetical protein
MRSTSPAMILRASAWAWRSASNWSRNAAMVSSLADMSAALSDRGWDVS